MKSRITAALLALAVPTTLPLWYLMLGVAVAVLLAKHAYGGLGQNPFNPAMVGYAVLLVSFPLERTRWPAPGGDWDAMTQGDDPLLTEVAAAVLEEAPPPVAEDSLADRAALIGAAEETRKLAEALLERFPPPGAAPPLPGAAE